MLIFCFHGRRVWEMIGPSRMDADKIIAKKKTEIIENKYLDIRKEPDPVKFHEFAKEYLQWAKANKKGSTCAKDISVMRNLDMYFEGRNLHEITTWDIEKWKVERKEKLKPASVNRELALVKHLFSKAVEWKKLKENPAKIIKRLKGETSRLRYLMPDEIQILLSNCDALIWGLLKSLVTVALHTGARQGELRDLKWPQIDFDLGIITLLDTKNGERRDISMNETVRTTLEALERKSEFVFPCTNGNGLNHARIHIAFHEVLTKSGIEDFHVHDLRHTFASNLVMNGPN